MGMIRKKYQPNLSDLMTLCSANYALMLRVFSNHEEVGITFEFFISDSLFYTFSIQEVTKYTSLVAIKQHSIYECKKETKEDLNSDTKQFAELMAPKMLVRLYHDAKLAEVISSQHIRQIKPRYDYPNTAMHQPDEKRQINQFLKEWLQICIEMGQVKITNFCEFTKGH